MNLFYWNCMPATSIEPFLDSNFVRRSPLGLSSSEHHHFLYRCLGYKVSAEHTSWKRTDCCLPVFRADDWVVRLKPSPKFESCDCRGRASMPFFSSSTVSSPPSAASTASYNSPYIRANRTLALVDCSWMMRGRSACFASSATVGCLYVAPARPVRFWEGG